MTVDQQREAALRLYRLVWRFPERAPEPYNVQDSDEYEFDGHTVYYVKAGIIFVEASVHDASYARVVILAGKNQKLKIAGTCGYIEDMLRLIPCSMRPHMENTK